MIYPDKFEQKIGFDRIRQMLLERCISNLGQNQVDMLCFLTDYDRLSTDLDQAEEFRQIILGHISFPSSNFYDPSEVFRHLKLEATFAEADVLREIMHSIETIVKIIEILTSNNGEGDLMYPALFLLVDGLLVDPALGRRIDSIVDEKSQVKSSASRELGRIRQKKLELEIKSEKRIRQILNEGKKQGLITTDADLSLRNGRLVIPVATSLKRKIRGFIHDQSASGQTVFLEPEEVFELNNQLVDLEFEERQEIIRILREFADYLRPMLPELILCYEMLGKVDAIRAKAHLAIDMNAYRPELKNHPAINWINARHPLLYMTYKPQKKHVEPFSAGLNADTRILVISGPNAGGKSVCLKAFGLIQYMLQCGLLIPLADYSECGIFKRLFIDIGDEQSLDNDLSTYSSHLLNMKYFLEKCNSETLFLIDEFGTGTEPRIGGAIAEAILASLNETSAYGVVTTHYANLKVMASKHPGLMNGSMLFDNRNMRPLFRLKTGNPGSSFAFEIARSIGLSEPVLKNAEELAGVQNVDFEKQLQDLEVRKMELEQKERELRSADDFLSGLIDKYQTLYDKLEEKKTELIADARKESKKILDESNRMIEKTIRDIRENQARQIQTKIARQRLDSFVNENEKKIKSLDEKSREKRKTSPVILSEEPLAVGDMVRISGQKSIGEVISLKGDQAVVSFGIIKLKTPPGNLEKLGKSSIPESTRRRSGIKMAFDINEKAANFNPSIDIRGLRAEEALAVLRNYIDDAILLGIKQVKILHGKGDGILRAVIREFLQKIPEIHRYDDEHPDRGGAGATIADFRN